jgi:serine/threonine protein kinase
METSGARSDPTQGQVIAGRYLLLSLCGKGGMGSVWRARHLSDERECAVKILHRTAPERIPHLAGRFLREAKVASAIDSPHAVRVLDYGVDDGVPFIAMELLEGETLAERLRSSGRMSAVETFAIVDQAAKALTRAHEIGVVHRDLKPDNVFLSRSSDGETLVKVLDFGIAKIIDEETVSRDLTETNALLGTPHYMSPEQIDGARYVDHRADLWSLSVIGFECITGRRPFQGDGLRALFLAICVHKRPLASSLCAVPAGFDAWFEKCTNVDPAKRFRSASELAEALGRVCDGNVAVSPPAGAELGTSAAGDDASTDSLSGSVGGPRIASENRPWMVETDGPKERVEGAPVHRPARRFRVPSFRVWGVFALLALAAGAWLSARGPASAPSRVNDSLAPARSTGAEEPLIPLPGKSAPLDDVQRAASALDGSTAVPKPEPRDPPKARAPRPHANSGVGSRPAPPLEAHASSPAPPAEAAPSAEPIRSAAAAPTPRTPPPAKPEVWNYGEMLKDRK